MVDRIMEQHKPVPAPFLTKTYQLVDDPSTDHIVSWGDDRLSTFVVWRPPEFARDVLPNYFKHNNFSSFVRQLNTYGFRKVVPERWEFANEYFRKGEKQLLCEIHRRKTPSSMPPSFSPSPPPFLPLYHPQPIHIPHHPPPPPPPRLLELASPVAGGDTSAAASALMEENERLRRHNAALMSELANMRKLYNDIIYFVQNHVQPVAPSSLLNQRRMMMMGLGLNANNNNNNSSGSTTSSSSLTIVEEPLTTVGNNNSSNGESSSRQLPRLFGVSLVSSSGGSKKRGLSLDDANDSSS